MTRFAGPYSIHNPWKLIGISVVTAALVFGFGVGFLVLPRYQQRDAPRSTWDSICRALGFQRYRSAQTTGVPPTVVPSEVVWTSETVEQAVHGDVARGEFIAINCSACHGGQGFSKRSWVPSLAGMDKLASLQAIERLSVAKTLMGSYERCRSGAE
jgi:cytochrome c553